jgi:hypothetical protein
MQAFPSRQPDAPYGPAPTSTEVETAARWTPAREAEEHHEARVSVVLAPDTRRVVMRLIGGGDIELGRTSGREAAVELARDVVAEVEEAIERDEWPELGERFVRPGAIVSIDIVRPE